MIILIVALILAGIAVAVASRKGRNQIVWFIFTFLFGGIPLLILAFLPNLIKQAQKAELNSTKPCPQCAERVKAEANICRFCSYDFSKGTVAPALGDADT